MIPKVAMHLWSMKWIRLASSAILVSYVYYLVEADRVCQCRQQDEPGPRLPGGEKVSLRGCSRRNAYKGPAAGDLTAIRATATSSRMLSCAYIH